MLRSLEVFALNEGMNRASGSINYSSLIWKRRYYECGRFDLYVPEHLYHDDWRYIYTNDRPETGIIESVSAVDDVKVWGGRDTVKLGGRFAESLAFEKVLTRHRVSGYGASGDNVAVLSKWMRDLYGDRFAYADAGFAGTVKHMAPKTAEFGKILYEELKLEEASFRMLYDFESNVWTFQPWRGLDRTKRAGEYNPYVFSDQLGTLRGYAATRDVSGYKNTCLVEYDYEEPSAWNSDGTPYMQPIYEWIPESSGTARELVGYRIPYRARRGFTTARIEDGMADREAHLDMTSEKPEHDGDWSRDQYDVGSVPTFSTGMMASYAAFQSALASEGLKHLESNYSLVKEVDPGEFSGGYLTKWDLGDKVDALLLKIGIDMEARVIGVDECYEGDTKSVTPIIGEKKHRKLSK